MAGVSKFTDEQKLEIAMELLSGKMPHAETCREWDISITYACKLKDRVLEILRKDIGRPAGQFPSIRSASLRTGKDPLDCAQGRLFMLRLC